MSSVREIERLTVYLTHALAREIRLDAARRGQSLSVWVKRAAEAALKEQEGELYGARLAPDPSRRSGQ